MDFGLFLFYTQRITENEYLQLRIKQTNHRFAETADERARRHAPIPLDRIDDLESIRERPFGAILGEASCAERLFGGRSEEAVTKGLSNLVDEWHEWHLRQLEPICTYSLTSRFGRRLYKRQVEKKLAARFIVNARVRGRYTIARDHDVVLIPDGTSGIYGGLAIAASRRNVTIHTSNSGLVREYRDNPAVARGLDSFNIIGGQADFDRSLQRSEYCGVFGTACQQQFKDAIRHDPAATIVIMPVTCLNAHDGPLVAGPTAGVKAGIINESLNITGGRVREVREIVFLADYTKLLARYIGEDEASCVPMFPRSHWQELVEKHRDKICIVTTAPPALRAAQAFGQGITVPNRSLATVFGPMPFAAEDHEYNRVAKELYDVCGNRVVEDEHVLLMFHEAYDTIADKALYVFHIDRPCRDLSQEHFVTALGQFVHGDLGTLEISTWGNESKTVVSIIDSAEVLGKLIQLCETSSPAVARLRESTGVDRVEAVLDGKPFRFDLPKLPVPA